MRPRSRPGTAALAIATLGAAALGGAWIFQYGFGIQPCPLCLEQRYAYYVRHSAAAMLAAGVSFGASRKVLVAGFVVIAGFMLWNAGLGRLSCRRRVGMVGWAAGLRRARSPISAGRAGF
jgi:disulfide bond formation protein DsbB